MKALTVVPLVPDSARLTDIDEPTMAIFGSVNANRRHYDRASRAL